MLGTRRSFLPRFAGIPVSLVVLQSCPPVPVPRRHTPVNPPEPMELLFARVRDLKSELEHTPTANVFSISIFKQTQEIEKLAKRLKNYAKA